MIPKYIYERFGAPMLIGVNKTTGVEYIVMEGWSSSIDALCDTQQDAEEVRAKLQELVEFISDMAIVFDDAAPEAFEKFYYITSKEKAKT